MSDLISRSALMESLIHCDGLGRKSLEAVIKTINEQPTAYDVEQVVKELEGRFYDINYAYNNCTQKEQLIGIVKGGGVNE